MSKTNRERAEIFCLEYFKMVRPFYLNALVSLLNKAENRGRRKERKRWKHYWMMCTPIDMKIFSGML